MDYCRRFFAMLAATVCFASSLSFAEAPQPQYVYRAEVTNVISGDRVAMNIDLGFGVWTHGQVLHLLDVVAPDPLGPHKEEALRLKRALSELLKDRSEIVIQTTRDKTVQPPRFMAVIWADGVNVNEALKAAK